MSQYLCWTTVSFRIFKLLREKQPAAFLERWQDRPPFLFSLELRASLPQPYIKKAIELLSLFRRFRHEVNYEDTGVVDLTDLSAGTGYRHSDGDTSVADNIVVDDAVVNDSVVNDSVGNDFVDNDVANNQSVECNSAV